MNIHTRQAEGILFVKPLEKSIEAGNSREFKRKVADLVDNGERTLVVNLAEVEFMDSSGLGSLISILKLLANAQGSIIICELREQVRRLFDLTRLDQVFQIFSKEEEAVGFLKNSASAVHTSH